MRKVFKSHELEWLFFAENQDGPGQLQTNGVRQRRRRHQLGLLLVDVRFRHLLSKTLTYLSTREKNIPSRTILQILENGLSFLIAPSSLSLSLSPSSCLTHSSIKNAAAAAAAPPVATVAAKATKAAERRSVFSRESCKPLLLNIVQQINCQEGLNFSVEFARGRVINRRCKYMYMYVV